MIVIKDLQTGEGINTELQSTEDCISKSEALEIRDALLTLERLIDDIAMAIGTLERECGNDYDDHCDGCDVFDDFDDDDDIDCDDLEVSERDIFEYFMSISQDVFDEELNDIMKFKSNRVTDFDKSVISLYNFAKELRGLFDQNGSLTIKQPKVVDGTMLDMLSRLP